MKKLSLDPDSLAVESFVSDDGAGMQGTVLGHITVATLACTYCMPETETEPAEGSANHVATCEETRVKTCDPCCRTHYEECTSCC